MQLKKSPGDGRLRIDLFSQVGAAVTAKSCDPLGTLPSAGIINSRSEEPGAADGSLNSP
jgi:hypothetical protein